MCSPRAVYGFSLAILGTWGRANARGLRGSEALDGDYDCTPAPSVVQVCVLVCVFASVMQCVVMIR